MVPVADRTAERPGAGLAKRPADPRSPFLRPGQRKLLFRHSHRLSTAIADIRPPYLLNTLGMVSNTFKYMNTVAQTKYIQIQYICFTTAGFKYIQIHEYIGPNQIH